MSSWLHKKAEPGLNGTPVAPITGGAWSSELPALVEFLAATAWSDGTSRLPGTLTLFTDDSQWKACLSDKAQSLIAFVSAPSPQEALQAAERGLTTATLDWRASSRLPTRKR